MYKITKKVNTIKKLSVVNKWNDRKRGNAMSFIGIISNRKTFENIKNKLKNLNNCANVIHISTTSISNIKNIKFEIIVIDEEISKFCNNQECLCNLCKKAQYVIANTDINKANEEYQLLKGNSQTLITYGLNGKANITVSSISEDSIMIYRQRKIINRNGKKQEIEERRIKIQEKSNVKIYEILILYTILSIYDDCIIEEI